MAKVKELCEGNQTCAIVVDNTNLGPDPCAGTYKYLEVEYECRGLSQLLMETYRSMNLRQLDSCEMKKVFCEF